jgi:membrane protein DedA with SNARE-associated domain
MVSILQDLIVLISNFIVSIISITGYPGVLFLMILESALMPIPSEIIMPFSGYLVYAGKFDIWVVTLIGTIGNLIGSWTAYFLGLYLGRNFILKYGKYILLKKKHLLLAEKWFKKYGDKTIFFSRMMPVVRTVISLPAGLARMNFKKFSIYTFIGSIPWNFALTYIGFWLGKNWKIISKYTETIDLLIIAGIIIFLIYFLRNRKK